MSVYTLYRVQYLPVSVQQAWDFFSAAKNLATITPPEMRFVIHTQLDEREIWEGMHIEYTVRPLLGIPLQWVTEIMNVDAPRRFTDRQIKGPYTLWEHTHSFEAVRGGVKMTDEVKYQLPLGVLGTLAHALVVKGKLEDIFDFRERTLKQLFGEYKQ